MKLNNSNTNNTKGFAGIVMLLVVVVLVVAGVMYATKTGLIKLNPKDVNYGSTTVSKQNAVHKVDFAYKVKSITNEMIVLSGQKGDFTLPNDPSVVIIHKGSTKESPKMELSKLKVGDTLNMEFIPGKSATLFVSTT